MNILNELNEEQKEAVLVTEGPVLILAGAGSGKTKCLTHRIAYIIGQKKATPFDILAITFTNKAAGEMKERMAKLLDGILDKEVRLPWMGTFHSICVKILRREAHELGYNTSFSIYDDDEAISLIKKIMADMNLDLKQYAPRAVKSFISGAKNEMMGASEYEKYAQGHFQDIVVKVFKRYETAMKNAHAMDFDDLIGNTVKLFQDKPAVLDKYQRIFKYILIDEYQDTNQAQYLLTKLLAAKHRNICAVGDDYQAIYGWRGANFRNLLNFEKDYPEAKVIKLERNYRSTKNILEAAQKIIEQNKQRTDKKLWTENDIGAPITVYQARTGDDEAEFVATETFSMVRTGYSWGDFAILYRTNAQSRIIEETFLKYKVPYRLVGALRFYDRKEVKDILAFLKLIANEMDEVNARRVINVPPRGIGPKSVEAAFSGESKKNEKVDKFWAMIAELRDAASRVPVEALIEKVVYRTGYKNYLLDGTPEGEARWENVEELMSVATESEDLGSFLEQTALVSDIDNYETGAEAVTLMTLHCAKGLEFPVVYMVGMEEGIMPHARSVMDASELEEERRLCYVGVTRAKERLYMSYALSRIVHGMVQANMRSRFIEELPEELLDILD